MARKSRLKIGSCVLAVALLGGTMMKSSYGDELGDNKRARLGDAKVIKIAPRNLLARPNLAVTPETPARNSIGVFVAHHEGPAQRTGERFPTVMYGPAFGPIGSAGSATGRLTNDEGAIVRLPPNSNLVVRPTILNRGTINGTSLIRSGASSSGIGGPAKTAEGINGTMIRPKR
jgi:hypothetical protein